MSGEGKWQGDRVPPSPFPSNIAYHTAGRQARKFVGGDVKGKIGKEDSGLLEYAPIEICQLTH